jgi:streptomycin 6-kinase
VRPPLVVHEYLRNARATSADGLAWLDRLPDIVADACRRWGLDIAGPPYDGGMCGWVAPVRGAGGDAVLKVTWPHPEAATEAAALRWWGGAGAVGLLAEDHEAWVMLLERCDPGTPLRDAGLSNERGLAMGAQLLDALWGKGIPGGDGPDFPSMGEVCDGWADLAARRADTYGAALQTLGTDPGILALGIEQLRTLPRSARRQVVVHGDFNPGNLLAAHRAPYLAIDPKPMVGDPAYDVWSLVAQLDWPFRRPDAPTVVPSRIGGLAERLDLPPERIAAWGIARDVEGALWLAAEQGDVAAGAKWLRSAALVAPMLG